MTQQEAMIEAALRHEFEQMKARAEAAEARAAAAQVEIDRLRSCFGYVAAAAVADDAPEAYHWAYIALTRHFQGSATEQAEMMRAAIDAARCAETGERDA